MRNIQVMQILDGHTYLMHNLCGFCNDTKNGKKQKHQNQVQFRSFAFAANQNIWINKIYRVQWTVLLPVDLVCAEIVRRLPCWLCCNNKSPWKQERNREKRKQIIWIIHITPIVWFPISKCSMGKLLIKDRAQRRARMRCKLHTQLFESTAEALPYVIIVANRRWEKKR